MGSLSDDALNQINKLLSDVNFPWDRLKSMELEWEYIDGAGSGFWLPKLEVKFYEKERDRHGKL